MASGLQPLHARPPFCGPSCPPVSPGPEAEQKGPRTPGHTSFSGHVLSVWGLGPELPFLYAWGSGEAAPLEARDRPGTGWGQARVAAIPCPPQMVTEHAENAEFVPGTRTVTEGSSYVALLCNSLGPFLIVNF